MFPQPHASGAFSPEFPPIILLFLGFIVLMVVFSAVQYLLSPVTEQDVLILGMTQETRITGMQNNLGMSQENQIAGMQNIPSSQTSYQVTARLEDGSSRDFYCSRSLYGQLEKGMTVRLRTKGNWILALA